MGLSFRTAQEATSRKVVGEFSKRIGRGSYYAALLLILPIEVGPLILDVMGVKQPDHAISKSSRLRRIEKITEQVDLEAQAQFSLQFGEQIRQELLAEEHS